MKLYKILMLLGVYIATVDCTFDVFTTSHVKNVKRAGDKRKMKPKQHFCSQGRIKKLKCQNKSNKGCKNSKSANQTRVCGFDNFGVKFDFNRECEAFERDQIKYYFQGTCEQVPRICTTTEECVNGLCIPLLQETEHGNRELCNTKADCPSLTQFCVANKCIQKSELPGLLQKAELKNPKLAQKQQNVRKQARKYEKQRKKKQIQELAKIMQQYKARRQKDNKKDAKSNTVSIRNQSSIILN